MADELSDLEQSPTVSLAASQRLYQAGLFSLVVALVYSFWTTRGDIDLAQLLALGTIVFATLPALRWAKTRCTWFPAFEISMLTCIAFYAVPLFKGSSELTAYEPSIRAQASLVVLIYTAFANFGFASVRHPGQAPGWSVETLLPSGVIRWVPAGMFLNVLYAYVSIFYDGLIPGNINGTLRALFFGIGTMATFVLARTWGLGRLSRQQAGFFLFNLTAYLVISFSSLYLIGGISMLALTLISYASARRRIPWLVLAAFGALISLLHLGKPEMRKKYWDPETNQSVGAPVKSLLDLPAYFSEWVGYSMAALQRDEANPNHESNTIVDRASLIQMICLSVEVVPQERPYLLGDSYVDIPAQVIPRFLWPGKPSSLLANIRLAVYFNLVDPDSGFSVSIAFGPLAEAYVNFGYLGVAFLGLLMGAGYKRVAMMSDRMPQFSALGIFMILLTAWSFQAEQVMATWLSSLFQACVVCIGVPVMIRKLFGI